MSEKFIQAVLITFLLELIAVLGNNTPLHQKTVSPLSEMSRPAITWNFQVLDWMLGTGKR